MTFDPFRDMRDAVPSEPPPANGDNGAASWLGLAFASAMLVLAAWYFWGDGMGPHMSAEAPAPAPTASAN